MSKPIILHRLPAFILCWLAIAGPAPVSHGAALTLDPERVNQLRAANEADGVTALVTEGSDPFILLQPFAAEAVGEGEHILAFEYFCPDGVEGLDVYFGPPITAANFLAAGPLRKSESWQPFAVDLREQSSGRWSRKFNQLRLDLGRRAGITVRIRKLELRTPTDAERQSLAGRQAVRARKQAGAEIVTRYLENDFPVRIHSVVVDREQIRIAGEIGSAPRDELRLIELQPWQQLWNLDGAQLLAAATEISPVGSRFTANVPRFAVGRDRITSRWAVWAKGAEADWAAASAQVYPTDLTAACEHPGLDRKTAAGLKGMGGVWANDILDELVELGVKHITDNIWISGAFAEVERPGWTRFQHDGRDWWVEPAFVHGHDRLIKFATDHGMVVSAIILVGFGEGGFAGRLQHPEADRAGHYAMPNLTTPGGVAAYEAAIHFLTQRYAQPGDPHGRISNWILHNEVDYGWEWTNMGAQPMPVFLDTYHRSMRIVHNLARRFNPHARTFISLTHNWDVPDDPAWKSYSPKRMLEALARYSRVEGDFEWGVAFHPYPQSLFQPAAWNDTLPTDEFDTPMITPKNIAVLDRWLQREEMMFQGRPRGVILSEQGFHTADYSVASGRLQGAAFVYMWRQLRGLKTIEAFHNHRWIDHPAEGGLKLGLRTLPTDGKPFGDRKAAWEVYRALETPAEAKVTRFADEVIGQPARR